jgi:hypothetical protein
VRAGIEAYEQTAFEEVLAKQGQPRSLAVSHARVAGYQRRDAAGL